jgi:hypothetical protein
VYTAACLLLSQPIVNLEIVSGGSSSSATDSSSKKRKRWSPPVVSEVQPVQVRLVLVAAIVQWLVQCTHAAVCHALTAAQSEQCACAASTSSILPLTANVACALNHKLALLATAVTNSGAMLALICMITCLHCMQVI